MSLFPMHSLVAPAVTCQDREVAFCARCERAAKLLSRADGKTSRGSMHCRLLQRHGLLVVGAHGLTMEVQVARRLSPSTDIRPLSKPGIITPVVSNTQFIHVRRSCSSDSVSSAAEVFAPSDAVLPR